MNNSNELEAGGVNRILAVVRNNLFWLELTNWKSTNIPIDFTLPIFPLQKHALSTINHAYLKICTENEIDRLV